MNHYAGKKEQDIVRWNDHSFEVTVCQYLDLGLCLNGAKVSIEPHMPPPTGPAQLHASSDPWLMLCPRTGTWLSYLPACPA